MLASSPHRRPALLWTIVYLLVSAAQVARLSPMSQRRRYATSIALPSSRAHLNRAIQACTGPTRTALGKIAQAQRFTPHIPQQDLHQLVKPPHRLFNNLLPHLRKSPLLLRLLLLWLVPQLRSTQPSQNLRLAQANRNYQPREQLKITSLEDPAL